MDHSVKTLQRIEGNDPTLGHLFIGTRNSEEIEGGITSNNEGEDFSRLSAAIGENTHLKILYVRHDEIDETALDSSAFFEGLKRNFSIIRLSIDGLENDSIDGGVGHKILNAYQEKGNLHYLRVTLSPPANLQNGGVGVIVDTLQRCKDLRTIHLECDITHEQMLPMIDAIRGLHKLVELNLSNNMIGDAGCGAIATLLEDPNSPLYIINLTHNNISNKGVKAIINSLGNNTRMEHLFLDENPSLECQILEDMFCRLLCNSSSINSIYSSNHALQKIVLCDFELGEQLTALRKLNKDDNKSHVAIKKILRYHPNIDMEPLFEWDADGEQTLKALPHIIDWFDRAEKAILAPCYPRDDYDYRVDQRKLSAIFQFTTAMPLLFVPARTAIVLIDPVTDWRQVVDAGLKLNYDIITVQLPDVALPEKYQAFLPSKHTLKEAGVTHTLSMRQHDIFSITQQLQVLAKECNVQITGVIPLSEVAVEVSDLIASCLGLPHNPLELMAARRDKGLMKSSVEHEGLRIAKYARVGSVEDIGISMNQLSLSYPIVVKTPSGFSTSGVFICSTEEEATTALSSIVGKTGPDGRTVDLALLEEYIEGTEFAVNLMAFINDDGSSYLLVTDMWKYKKTEKARYNSAEICNAADYPQLIVYACKVAKAVGIKFGAAHVELKAKQDDNGEYVNPVMIEIGARLSGGRKSTLAQAAIDCHDPFSSLIKSHCGGESCQTMPSNTNYLTPARFVRHIFLPIERAGRVNNVELDTSTLTTLHSSVLMIKEGDIVIETSDIVTCAGFVWLIGDREQVDKDTKHVLDSFSLILE